MCADTAKCANILIRKGIFDWKHTPERLKSHEQSKEHIDAVAYAENFHGGGWFKVKWWLFVFGVRCL